MRSEILDAPIEDHGRAHDRDLADDFAGLAARTQRQARVKAGNVAREQQIALSIENVEYGLIVESGEIALEQRLIGAGVAAYLDARHPRCEDGEPDDTVIDRLRRDADGGEIDRKSTRLNSSHVKISY